MAKKNNENKLSYLQAYIPNTNGKAYRSIKRDFSGYNKRITMDTGMLSMERNMSTDEAPYLVPSKKFERLWDVLSGVEKNIHGKFYTNPIGMFAHEDDIIVVYQRDLYYIKKAHSSDNITKYTSYGPTYEISKRINSVTLSDLTYSSHGIDFEQFKIPSFAAFSQINPQYDGTTMDAIVGRRHYFLFNDNTRFFWKQVYNLGSSRIERYEYKEIERYTNDDVPFYRCAEIYVDNGILSDNDHLHIASEESTYNKRHEAHAITSEFPSTIQYGDSNMSRMFYVGDKGVFASNFNDFVMQFDTSESYNAANGWYSTSKVAGYTGVKSFMGRTILFSKNNMQEVYGTKNPFRLHDIYPEGAIDYRTIQEVNGKLIFVSEDGVKIYTGSDPVIISYGLNIDKFKYAVSGTDGKKYYLYAADDENGTNGTIYVYNTENGAWSEQEFVYPIELEEGFTNITNCHIINFAFSERYGMLAFVGFSHDEKTTRLTKLTESSVSTDPEKKETFSWAKSGRIIQLSDEYADTWSFETDLMTNQTIDIKHLRKIQMLADIGTDAYLKIYALYGDEQFNANTSQLLYDSNGKTGQQTIRVKPRKTASYGFKLHIEGEKFVKIYELEMIIEAGGEQYV